MPPSAKKRRICFLNMPIEFYSPVTGGAISTIIAETACLLEQRGHEVTVLTRMDGTPNHPHGQILPLGPFDGNELNLVQRQINKVRWRMNRWDWPYFGYYRRAVRRAAKQLAAPPEIVIVFNDLLSPVFLHKLFPEAKIYVWLQNEQRTRERDLSAASAATWRWLTCSSYIRDWTLAQHGFAPDRVVVVPSGVNLQEFRPRDNYDAPVEDLAVLFVGRLDPNKGPDIAVDAVSALRAEELRVSMTVVGAKWFYRQGDEEADPFIRSLREKIELCGAAALGHVPRDHIAEVFRRHDVVCVLSRSNEPFGLVALEAMASGCAVIASNRGGIPEACGGAASLVNPDDAQAVRRVIRRFSVDGEALAEAKREAYKHARASSWDLCVDRLEEIFAQSHLP